MAAPRVRRAAGILRALLNGATVLSALMCVGWKVTKKWLDSMGIPTP